MTNAIKKNGINFGIIMGVFLILVTAIMYSVDLKLFTNSWIGIVNFVINITIGCIAVAKAKSALGGFITFKEAFTTFFITMLIGVTLNVLFTAILFNVIDPGAKETLMEHMIEYTVEMMQKFNTPDDMLKQTVEQMRKDDGFGFLGQLQAWFFQIIIYSIIGLIIALIFKNKAKETL